MQEQLLIDTTKYYFDIDSKPKKHFRLGVIFNDYELDTFIQTLQIFKTALSTKDNVSLLVILSEDSMDFISEIKTLISESGVKNKIFLSEINSISEERKAL
jgi:hypothetical protein